VSVGTAGSFGGFGGFGGSRGEGAKAFWSAEAMLSAKAASLLSGIGEVARGSMLARSSRSAVSVVLRARDELEDVGDRIGADEP